jgi:tripartite-type tricarboxylate transporter receptor subunit TctC
MPTPSLRLAALLSILATAATCLMPTAASATYPERPITIVVPYAAGGITDLSARALAEGLSKELDERVIVQNKPGASGSLGGAYVASAAPDGYTLGFFPMGASTPEVFRFSYTAPYKSTDLRAISSVTGTALAFAVLSDSPLKSMKDVIAMARSKGGLMIGTSGSFTLPSMIMTSMARKEGVKLENVPFDADAKTLPALLGGHVEIAAIDYSVMKGFVESGKLRVLATCTEERTEFTPNAPSIRELGYELPYVSALGLFGPARLPDAIVQRLDQSIARIAASPAFREKVHAMNIITLYKNAAAFQKATFRDRDNLERFFAEMGAYK